MFKRVTILIVEDDNEFADVIADSIALQGWFSVKTNTIGKTILCLKNQKFDCILLDMNLLNNEKGEDLIKIIKNDETLLNLDTPLIIISGSLDGGRLGGIYKQVSDILLKPFDVPSLINKILKHIKK